MKRVISFSLFGDVFGCDGMRKTPVWIWQFLPSLIRGYISLFPGWELWFYHDENIYSNYYGSVLRNLQNQGLIRLIYVPEEPLFCKAMLWRMKPLWESDVEYFLCRDVDHTPTGRERKMVEIFVNSGAQLHCINDNPSHNIPMLGGMVGFKAQEVYQTLGFKNFDEFISSSGFSKDKWLTHGSDQICLNTSIWPLLKQNSCLHRLGWKEKEPSSPLCYFDISPVQVKDVSELLLEKTNTFCNFIGTSSPKRDEYIKFLDDVGPQDKIKLVKEAESIASIKVVGRACNTTNQFSNNNKKVILSSDTNPNYCFFLPVVSLVWQKVMEYCPVVIVVGSKEKWLQNGLNKFILNKSREIGAEIYFINSMEGHRDSTIAQVSRLYAGMLGYAKDTYLLTSDIDMLPLSKEFFSKQDFSKKVHLFYGNVYQGQKFPISYIGANLDVWLQIMQKVVSQPRVSLTVDILYDCIQEQLDAGLGKNADDWTAWNYDELLFGTRIREWKANLEGCQIIERYGAPPIDRIDRSNWQFNGSIAGKVDAHLLRPGYTQENWQRIKLVLRILLPDEFYRWVEDYYVEFIRIKETC